MRKLSVFLESGKNVIYLDGFIRTEPNSKLKIKNASVYWNYQNITGTSNYFYVTTVPKSIVFENGYWTFHMLAERFAENGIKLVRNRYDNTCKIYSETKDLVLNSLGLMLEFPITKGIIKKAWTTSPSVVDVNLGLKYVTVECGAVDMEKNFDRWGKRSKVVATFPVTTEQSLNNSVSHYRDIESEAPIVNGDHNFLEFFVDTNLGKTKKVDVKIMLELYFE